MSDIRALLREVCGDPAAGEDGVDLIESGLLDSLAVIELFTRLEEEGVVLIPTRVDREKLRTAAGIEALVAEARRKASSQSNP
ncbi:MAG: D-alanine--poly(phosphoribitol) ligase subunit 2 [Clostridiales bacterium]|jgi:acyl carrier protein|nr:D-alanine--poly(phosphoribitol) ligase subunit 2 [Clostridiales bacterium]